MEAIVVGSQVILSNEYELRDAEGGPLKAGVVGLVTRVDSDSVEVQAPSGQQWLYAREALIHAPVPSDSNKSDAADPAVESAVTEEAASELDDDAFDEDETDENGAVAEDHQRESCLLCGNMFMGQERMHRPDGTEVHGECHELHRLLPRKIRKDGSGGGGRSACAAADDTVARRGTCALCGEGVFETDRRRRGQSKGDYVHEYCHRRLETTEAAAACWSESSLVASDSSGRSGGVGAASSDATSRVPSTRTRALTPRSRNALTMFSESAAATSAADVAFAEELLVCGATKLNEQDRKQVRTAVALGDLGTAGAFLVGKTLSAPCTSAAADSGSSRGTASGALTCPICFDTVELEGAAAGSGGAVSCFNGHAMHAACASGLALSGGACPECREPLFFAKLNPIEAFAPEAQASLAAASGSLIAGGGGGGNSSCKDGHDSISGGGGGGGGGAGSSATTFSSSVVTFTVNGQGAPMQQSAENGMWYCGRRNVKLIKKDEESTSPKEGDTVVLSEDYVKRAGGKYGPLKPGQEGTVIEVGRASLRVQTFAPGEGTTTRCYLSSDLERKLTDADADPYERVYTACSTDDGRQCRSCKQWTGIAKAMNSTKAANTAAAHMVRMRTELATVKSARAQTQVELVEELQKRMSSGSSGGSGDGSNKERVPPAVRVDENSHQLGVPPAPPTLQRQITSGSNDAIDFLLDKVMGADYLRGRHLLALAAQWGDAPDAVAARAALHEYAKAGDLDSVAREIRARNASLVWENGMWVDVVVSNDITTEWTVSPLVSIPLPLRCSAKATSRPTGYFLKAGQRFSTAKEWLDPETGNLWLKLAKKQPLGGGAGIAARGRTRERSESPVRDEGSSSSSSSTSANRIPRINDEGAPVTMTTRPGSGNGDKYYCGRRLGRSLIPDSDGQCGPNSGPQCASCVRYMAWMKHEALMLLPPGEHAGEWRGSSKHQWCSLASSREGLLCTHGGQGPGGLVLSKHWSCCGTTHQNAPCTITPTKESSKLLLAMQPLQEGDLVVLSKEYKSCGDAADGPLKEVDVGVVEHVRGSPSGLRLSVRRLPKVGGTSWSSSWRYSHKALKRAPLPDPPLEEADPKKKKEKEAAAATMATLLPDGQKACGACTFYNEPSRTACEMCGIALVLPTNVAAPPASPAPRGEAATPLTVPASAPEAARLLPLPPQGWLLVRPGGPGTSAVAQHPSSSSASRCPSSQTSSSNGESKQTTLKGLRCFGCGHGFLPPLESAAQFPKKQGFASGSNANTLKVGQIVLVASTLEPAVVVGPVDAVGDDYLDKDASRGLATSGSRMSKSASEDATKPLACEDAPAELMGKRAMVVFPNERSVAKTVSDDDEEEEEVRFSFECSELLVPGVGLDDMKMINGFPHSRYECWLLHQRDNAAARTAWDLAPSWLGHPGTTCGAVTQSHGSDFASCVRGHLLHAHCFQRALLEGAGCPACPEPLFVPRVERTDRADDDCHQDVVEDGGHASSETRTTTAAAGALQAARAVEGEAATMIAPSSEDGNDSGRTSIRSVTGRQLRMCPACCAGPLINENCSDMRAHHGQCPKCLSKIQNADAVIASALASASSSRSNTSVMALLPSCPNSSCEGAKVLFNGCIACSHLFANTGDNEWDRLPLWDPSAASEMALDAKARSAARLLAAQVRNEAAHLEHERRALRAARSPLALSAEDLVEPQPPLPVPHTSRWAPLKPPGCGPTCERSHSGDGNCLVCGQSWGIHNGHTCRGGSRRGSWRA